MDTDECRATRYRSLVLCVIGSSDLENRTQIDQRKVEVDNY